MKSLSAFASIAAVSLAFALGACGSKDSGNSSAAPAAPVAGAAAPAGTTWAETVAPSPEGSFMMGNPNAPIKLVEFASYTCSHCRDFSAESAEPLRAMVNSGKVSYELRNFLRDPLDMAVALLARCGGKDPYYPLSEQFFTNQAAMFEKAQAQQAAYQAAMAAPADKRFVLLGESMGLIDFAKQRGIAEDQAKQCLADTKAAETLADGVKKATDSYAISGTPTFLINGKVVENSANWETLKAKLKEAGV
ncbi:thioredoxin domain-containing protein [Sphingobium aquiterrae]|uniref:thioredoxin domain-containing protein n=1 Tax=Sphingobium aquiterrae TaxID=2038656 RepID=UPI00301ACFA4